MITAGLVAERLDALRGRIAAAGGAPDITIVAVTKGFGPEAIDAAVQAGCLDIGENYAQELVAKIARISVPRPHLHFIGHLQTNKVKLLAPLIQLWQTIDRVELGAAVARRAPGARVLVQVNVTGEPQKGGCEPATVGAVVDGLRALGLRVEGLMTVGLEGGAEAARPGFRLLRSLVERLDLPVCSMGMTDDLDAAVQEGATMVRIGSFLFGQRPRLGEAAQ